MKIIRHFRHILLSGAALAIASAQTLPAPISTTVTANATGALRTPATFWTANAGAIGSALSLNATYQPLSSNLTTWAAKAPYSGNLTIRANSTVGIAGNGTLTLSGNGTLGSAAYTASSAYLPAVTPGTSGNLLTSNGTAWISASGLSGDQTLSGNKTFNSPLTIIPPSSTQIDSSAYIFRAGGMSVPPTGYITARGGKQWHHKVGGGVFTATSGVYAGRSEIDATTTWGYNLGSGAPNDDVQLGMGFESRYLNAQSDLSSEWYLFWQSPLHGPSNNQFLNRRPIQLNISHEDTGIAGRQFQTDFTLSAETFIMLGSSSRVADTTGGALNNDRFFRVLLNDQHSIETSGSFSLGGNLTVLGAVKAESTSAPHSLGSFVASAGGQQFAFAGSQLIGDLQIQASTSSISFWRGGASNERLVIGAAANGPAFGNSTTNIFPIDHIGTSSGNLRPIIIRRSTNGGTSYANTAAFTPSGRILFGSLNDSDTANETLQVAGTVVSRGSVGGTSFRAADDGWGFNGFDVRSDAQGGWGITTRRGSTEAFQIGSARGGSGNSTMWGGLNNIHAISSIGSSAGNRRPIVITSSVNEGTSFSTFATVDFANSRLDLSSGTVLSVSGTQVVGPRETGWTASTGTALKGSYSTYTSPTISTTYTAAEVQAMADSLQAAARRIKALEDALRLHGLIN